MSIFKRCINKIKELLGFQIEENNNKKNDIVVVDDGAINIDIKDNEEKKVKLYRKKLNRRDSMIDINENDQQMTKNLFASFIEIAKVSMATLLSIFVPQFCENTGTTCTLAENFSDLSMFNEFVIAWNFITLGLFVRLSYIANKREAYLISHLDESREKPYNSLEENLYLYPKYIRRVREHNRSLKIITRITTYFFVLNIIFSCILIFYFFYDGFRSVSTLLANVLLVSNKLYLLHTICEDCNGTKTMALSTISLTPVSYNVVDKDRVTPEERRRSEIESRALAVKKISRKRAFSAPRA